MNQHLKTASSADPAHQHQLKSSFGLPSRHQHAPDAAVTAAGTAGNTHLALGATRAAGGGSGSSTPNSLHGFTPVSPPGPRDGAVDDAVTEAWEAVEQFYGAPNPAAAAAAAAAGQNKQHYPPIPGLAGNSIPAAAAPGSDPAATDGTARRTSLRNLNRTQQQQQQQYYSFPPEAAAAAPPSVDAAAAVQLAAGVSLSAGGMHHSSHAQQGGHRHTARADACAGAGAGPSNHPAVPVSSRGVGAQAAAAGPPQQQQEGGGGGDSLGTFGVSISGQIMAAMGGWMMNQAISAAATTATASFVGEAARLTAAAAGGGAAVQQGTVVAPVAAQAPPPPTLQQQLAAQAAPLSAPPAPPAPAATAGVEESTGLTRRSSSGSWWRRRSPSKEAAAAAAAAPEGGFGEGAEAEAPGGGRKSSSSSLKSSLKAAAQRTGLRRKASANAAAATATAPAAAGPDGAHKSSQVAGRNLGSEVECEGGLPLDSEGSAEYSQLLAMMDRELRGAAAAGAAAAVTPPATMAAAAAGGGRWGGQSPGAAMAGSAGGQYGQYGHHAAAGGGGGAAAGGGGVAGGLGDYDELVTEDLGDDFAADGTLRQPSSGWLQAMGLTGGGSSRPAASTPAAGAGQLVHLRDGHSNHQQQYRYSSGSDGSYYMVGGQQQQLNVADSPLAGRARVLRGVLLWRQPSTSAKALGCGLYTIMLVSNIPRALHYMQVTTVLPGVALLYLLYNLLKPWAIRVYCSIIKQPGQAVVLQARLAAAEAAAATAAIRCSAQGAVITGEWLLAGLALAHRALRARRFTTTCWTVVALWLLLLLSELRVINQMLLAMLAYAGLFCVPWMYQQFRGHIDTVVYDTFHFLTLLLVNAERWAYALAAAAAGLVWHVLQPAVADAGDGSGASVVVRGTAAASAAFLVLLWRVAVSE